MKHRAWLLLKLSLTVLILGGILRFVPLSQISESLRQTKLSWVVASYLLVLLGDLLMACRMKVLTDTQGLTLSTWQLFQINLSTTFYGLFVPGYIALPIRWYKISRCTRKSLEGLTSIIHNRLIQTTTLVLAGLLFWLVDPQARSNELVGIGLLGVLTLLVASNLTIFSQKTSRWLGRYAESAVLPTFARTIISRLLSAIGRCNGIGQLRSLKVWGYSALVELMGVLSFWLVAESLGIGLSMINAGWIRSVTTLVVMLPVSVSGFGVREGSLIFMLGPYGVPASAAVALSLLLFSRRLALGGLGLLCEIKDSLRSRAGEPKSAASYALTSDLKE
jgi:uncharacterized protein (TIRG00374 family)